MCGRSAAKPPQTVGHDRQSRPRQLPVSTHSSNIGDYLMYYVNFLLALFKSCVFEKILCTVRVIKL